jgi:hypothetical protein
MTQAGQWPNSLASPTVDEIFFTDGGGERTSASTPQADLTSYLRHVRFGPTGDNTHTNFCYGW